MDINTIVNVIMHAKQLKMLICMDLLVLMVELLVRFQTGMFWVTFEVLERSLLVVGSC